MMQPLLAKTRTQGRKCIVVDTITSLGGLVAVVVMLEPTSERGRMNWVHYIEMEVLCPARPDDWPTVAQ